MLMRNSNVEEVQYKLFIQEMTDHVLKREVLTGDKTGQIVFICRLILTSENDYAFIFRRRQFPIELAFAMTINKLKRQTLNKISLNFQKQVFSHGHVYVALSRVRSWNLVTELCR